jgi:cytochrome c553
MFLASSASEQLDENLPDEAAFSLPGSTRSYGRGELANPFEPPDWYPNEHPPMPKIVAHGTPGQVPQLPCALCHLPNGMGHVESASLAGLDATYIEQQFAAWRSGERRIRVGGDANAAFLTRMKAGYAPADIASAARYFAALTPKTWIEVRETTQVPASAVVRQTLMRLALPGSPAEALGERIVELPVDPVRLKIRDAHSGFVAYAPPGSLERGQRVVSAPTALGVPCGACHGAALKGQGAIPALAGRPASYLMRQLYAYKTKERTGAAAEPMMRIAAPLSNQEMLAAAAYLASLPP